MLSPHGPRIQACPPPQGGRESSGSVCAPSSASWLGGTRNQVPRPQYVSRAAPGHQLVFCVHLVPSGHTLPWWAGSLLGLLPGAVLRALATSITALRPPAQSMTAWGLGGPSHAEEAVEDLPPMPPPSCILTATSRQRAHFIRRQWPSRDDMSPDPGGAGGKAQGRGPRAGPGGCRELPGRSSWPRTEGLQPTPPQTPVCCQDLWGPTHPAEGKGSMCPSCRRLDAELSMAALLSVLVVPPPTTQTPWQSARRSK